MTSLGNINKLQQIQIVGTATQPSPEVIEISTIRQCSRETGYSFVSCIALGSVVSVVSLLSILSISSVASILSSSSVLSILSTNSVLSIGCMNSFLKICFTDGEHLNNATMH